ncbi:metastasis-associated protein MTA [Paragonimus westermani]|uniref:Metastasis-associated protein MTA n=1 Tax=Paragonimus westermani TaxID=34504 RepID=A0A5J4NBC1_9TREM|nr:metastasis-associated protein MTA [Paragonimus westermani]
MRVLSPPSSVTLLPTRALADQSIDRLVGRPRLAQAFPQTDRSNFARGRAVESGRPRANLNDNDSDEEDSDANGKSAATANESSKRSGSVADLDKHRIKHRELFLSRQIECLPATHIRGKCSVTLYNDAEPLANYLAREDAFYYKLIYDPSLKTLQEDRGAMRIGSDHQSEIQPLLKSSETDPRFSSKLEELVWQPGLLTNEEVDMFCLLARAVGTLGRGYDNASTTRQPLLLGAAASAGRDITRQYAHDLLHKANYDIKVAISLLLPGGQPVVCRDQLEDWSPSEAHLFEEALDKYSKVFPDILSDYLPWKTHKSLVELYYFWKTTDRYVRQRRTKLAAQEHKLKQVYIPNYSKPSPSVLFNGSDKVPVRTLRHPAVALALNNGPRVSGQPSAVNARYPDGIGLPVALAGGSRGTQCFKTPSVIRLARILCPDLIRPLLLARRPARHASSTGSKTLSMDTSSQAENALSLNDLKTAGEILCFPTFC